MLSCGPIVFTVFKKASITQHDPSSGHSASPSTLSQSRAKNPLTHSPLHGVFAVIFGLVVVVCGLPIVAIVPIVPTEILVEVTVFGLKVVDDEGPLYDILSAVFSSKRLEFARSIINSSGGGASPNASLDTQHLYPDLQRVSIAKTASQ